MRCNSRNVQEWQGSCGSQGSALALHGAAEGKGTRARGSKREYCAVAHCMRWRAGRLARSQGLRGSLLGGLPVLFGLPFPGAHSAGRSADMPVRRSAQGDQISARPSGCSLHALFVCSSGGGSGLVALLVCLAEEAHNLLMSGGAARWGEWGRNKRTGDGRENVSLAQCGPRLGPRNRQPSPRCVHWLLPCHCRAANSTPHRGFVNPHASFSELAASTSKSLGFTPCSSGKRAKLMVRWDATWGEQHSPAQHCERRQRRNQRGHTDQARRAAARSNGSSDNFAQASPAP